MGTKQLNESDKAIIEDRRAKAWELRLKGKSTRQIALALEVSVGTAHSDLAAVMERTKEENDDRAETHRAVSLARLERALDTVEDALSAESFDALGNKDHELRLKALDRLLKIEERRAKLLGLDAASKQELSGPEGAPIEINARDALVERLAGLIAGETAGATAQGDPGPTESGGSESA